LLHLQTITVVYQQITLWCVHACGGGEWSSHHNTAGGAGQLNTQSQMSLQQQGCSVAVVVCAVIRGTNVREKI